jgi:mannitol-1-phosphate 5-dehydrogenase
MGGSGRIVIIGAGATGRGQLGQVAYSAGWAVTYIERDRELVDALRQSGRFRVGLAGERIVELEVSGFQVFHTSEQGASQAIADADILATAVLPTNLQSTVPTIAQGLKLRRALSVAKPLNVIACENMERSSSTLKEYLKAGAPDLDWAWIERHVGFPDAMVARAVPVPKDNPLYLMAEANQEWSVDRKGLREPMPRLEGMTLSDNQEAALERKLYIKNTGHFAIGILGFRKGYALMDQAARDREVFAAVDQATRESAWAVATRHGFDQKWLEDYRATFLEQMKSPFLPDEVSRVIREPMRKLTREERLVGPAMLACELGGKYQALARMIALVLTLDNPADAQCRELKGKLARDGARKTIAAVCGVPEGHPLGIEVEKELQLGSERAAGSTTRN